MNRPAVRDIDVKSVLTPSNLPVADFSANPYGGCAHACRYCYASFMKRFTGHAEPWGEFVDVKTWPPLRHPERHAGKEVFIGSVTDPYQPLEETRRRTRALLEQLQGSGIAVSIATKSDLVLRDLDLLKTFPHVRVSFSVNTLDEDFRVAMDSAPSIARRLDAMAALHAAGIRTTCFVSPIFPGITDVPAIIDRARAHCNLVWLENLNLRGDYKARILAWIAAERPALVSPLRRHLPPRRPHVLARPRRNPPRLLRRLRPPLSPRRRHAVPPLRRPARRRQLLFPRTSQEIRPPEIGGHRKDSRTMNDCLIREYAPADLPAMIAIWNAVVETGDAFPLHLFGQLGTIRGGFRMKDGPYANICPYWHEL